jgi:UDP-sugar transporter A1/2/3
MRLCSDSAANESPSKDCFFLFFILLIVAASLSIFLLNLFFPSQSLSFSPLLPIINILPADAPGKGFTKLLWLASHSTKILILVFVYSICNLLSYYALGRIEASVYTVLLQLKILTTAAFSVIIIGRYISWTRWRALCLLVVGCVLVASPAYNRPVNCEVELSGGGKKGDDDETSVLDTLLGVGAVLVMVTLSGYSAIYFELLLKKGEKLTIWERNFQLALYSSILMFALVISEKAQADGPDRYVFFKGWTVCAVLLACIAALGGLLVAATLKYADAILKTLATSGSIVMSAVIGYIILGGTLDIFVGIGAVGTILAIFNYTFDNDPQNV